MKKISSAILLITITLAACDESGLNDMNRAAGETEGSTELLDIIHRDVVMKLYGTSAGVPVQTASPFTTSVKGPDGGSAGITKIRIRNIENNIPFYDEKYIITFTGYRAAGFLIEGSFTFYTGQRYESISSPPTADFIYTGGGEGGGLSVSGNTSESIEVSITVKNILNDPAFHFHEVILLSYKSEGSLSRREIPMLAGLYRKVFRNAFMGLLYHGTEKDSKSLAGPEGGVVLLTIACHRGLSETLQTDTFTFIDYKDNGLILNGTLSRTFRYKNRNGDIVSGCSNQQYMKVTGLYNASVKHIQVIDKPGNVWNFRTGYFVDRFYYESVSIRLGVDAGFSYRVATHF